MAAIGIDLGTTNCCVAAVMPNGIAEVIINDRGKRTTPSTIAFFRDHIYYGTDAVNLFTRCPDNVIYGLKYLIGRDFNEIEDYRNKMGYTIMTKNNRVAVTVTNKSLETIIYPIEELTALLLKQLKIDAEKRLDQSVETVVVTVPTYFEDTSRQATIDAAKIAGFKNVHLLNEPTAAAIAYGEKFVDKKTILVFDLGGGTFDISIISVNKDECSVLAIDGHLHLGGDNIDNNIADYFINKMPDLFTKKVKKNNRHMHRLKMKCESAKQDLSTRSEAFIELEEFTNSSIELSIDEFNQINHKFFDKCMSIMKNCMEKAQLTKENIDAVLLVGGSTRNQQIKKLVASHMGSDKLKEDANPDEVVAVGAAIMASRMIGKLREIKVHQLSAHSLGTKIVPNGAFHCLIPKLSRLPIRTSEKFKTVPHGKQSANIYVYSGERAKAKENVLLAKILIEDIHENPDGCRTFTLTFELDSNGILQVCADDNHGAARQTTITLDKGTLSNEEVKVLAEKMQNMQLTIYKSHEMHI